ncbi:MarR family winged helix-turn-helix transcriptional regulator [Corynebacterium caspium]|uniref:MarR family winged helix-turn-helix transcriptional regulator n=1 Tax=Corynebacterium caspium TaxID=234828 RepID=UPI00036A3648|nr:MarR family winged helix-turn-helix transcriptional regulator [Corynebacterium caspium]
MKTTPRWLNDEEQSLWRLILAATRTVDRALDETLQRDHSISSAEYAVLVSLSEAEGESLRLRDICTSLDWDRSRTSHQVTRMEKRGLVAKQNCVGDARGVVVQLTEAGKKRLNTAVPEHVESVRRLIFDHLTPEQLPVLEEFFENVLKVDSVPGTKGFGSGALSEECSR